MSTSESMCKGVDFDGVFYDDNLNNMDWWRAKHRGYAKREAADDLAFARGEISCAAGVDKFINGGCFDVELDEEKPEVLHIHCIWSPALHHCSVVCRTQKVPYVIAPRGMLELWSLNQNWNAVCTKMIEGYKGALNGRS